jgi:hypothetical protein
LHSALELRLEFFIDLAFFVRTRAFERRERDRCKQPGNVFGGKRIALNQIAPV